MIQHELIYKIFLQVKVPVRKKISGCRRRLREGQRMEAERATDQQQLVEVKEVEEVEDQVLVEDEGPETTTAMKSELSVYLLYLR